MLRTDQLLLLLATPGIGPATVRHALAASGDADPQSAEDLRAVLAALRRERPRIPVPTLAELATGANRAAVIAERAARDGIVLLGASEAAFPPALRAIPDAPVLLYAKGATAALTRPVTVAVVGTREPTPYGLAAAARIAGVVAEHGVVVSGLAAGCDTAAHEGCLAAGGVTVAVLAHGLDRVYPARNRDLAARIVAGGGCLLSEYAPGVEPQRRAFVERDRLQSGLSQAVIVIETDVQGGTMHTVRHCLAQGRTLACLAHPPHLTDEPKAQGNRQLVAEGKAVPLQDKDDLAAFLDTLAGVPATSTGANAQLPLF